MRIAIYHNLPSGGAKRTLGETAKRLAARHDIDVYTLSSANHEFADIRPYVANHFVYDFQPRPLFESPWGRLNQASRYLDLLRLDTLASTIAADVDQGAYDAVFVEPCQFETAPSLLAHLKHPNTIYYCHEPIRLLYEPAPWRPYDEGRGSLRRALDRVDPLPTVYYSTLRRNDLRNARRAGVLLVNSLYNQSAVQAIYEVDACVSYHGVDVEQFSPHDVSKEDFVLTVGSLTPLKGMDFLIHALACVKPSRRPPLVVASNSQNPPERAYLSDLAQSRGVEMRLMGNISDALLVQLYRQARLTVYAPIREPFGLVPLESMACGTPVVGVREGGIPETIIDGQTGLLVERDKVAFGDAVDQLLCDEKQQREYSSNARTHVVENWSWEKAVSTLERTLEPVH